MLCCSRLPKQQSGWSHPLGPWGDPLNLGNGAAYAGNNPIEAHLCLMGADAIAWGEGYLYEKRGLYRI